MHNGFQYCHFYKVAIEQFFKKGSILYNSLPNILIFHRGVQMLSSEINDTIRNAEKCQD